MGKLSKAQITTELKGLKNWKKKGATISRTFEFKDFPAAMRFTNKIATAAEKSQHHPDIDVRWNKVTLALTTHDAGGLTEKDFQMAGKANQLAIPGS